MDARLAFGRGQDDWECGKERKDNPFTEGSNEYELWRQGWEHRQMQEPKMQEPK
jgi:hypothetical protein